VFNNYSHAVSYSITDIYEFDLRAGLVNELVDVDSAISKEASLVS